MRLVLLTTMLMCALVATVNGQVSVTIEVNDTPTADDDYFCWTPHRARIRLETPLDHDVTVRLAGTADAGAGRIAFGRQGATLPTAADWSPTDTLELTLGGSGAWAPFLVSGVEASTTGKDVAIVATDAVTGDELGTLDVMVRVRKNADTLTPGERDRLLAALANLNGHNRPVGPSDAILKYALVHQTAFRRGIHGGSVGNPLFLVWHRAFVLSLERELQAIDASVTIPYWRFDEPSSNIFTEEFMGTVTGGISSPAGTLVRFAPGTNPLSGWRMPGIAALVRGATAQDAAEALQNVFVGNLVALDDILSASDIGVYGGTDPSRGANARLESVHHNYAHVSFGGGPITSGDSPRDPMFFLLHTNVDRAFAEWQAKFGRFGASLADSYSHQGSFESTANPTVRKGSYSLDPMWPWSQDDGMTTPAPGDDWPTLGFVFRNVPGFGPVGVPTPVSMIDYLNTLGGTEAIGACYDDLKFIAVPE